MKKIYDLAVIENNTVATDTIELVLKRPEEYIYKVGQYAFLDVGKAEKITPTTSRPMSIASHPDEDVIRFVMRTSESDFKKTCITLKKGDIVKISSPTGNFGFKFSDKEIVFLISGIGIAPVIPMLKELEKINYKGNVSLFYSNRTEDKATYKNKIENFKIENFKFYPVFTGIQPRINSELLKSKLGDLTKSYFYIIGTSEFINSMKLILEENNLTKDNYLMDNFG